MKPNDKNRTADAKGCVVTGAENGSTKVGARIMSKTVTGANEHDGKYRSEERRRPRSGRKYPFRYMRRDRKSRILPSPFGKAERTRIRQGVPAKWRGLIRVRDNVMSRKLTTGVRITRDSSAFYCPFNLLEDGSGPR